MMFKQASCEDELFESMQIAQDQAVIKEDNNQNLLVMQAMQELNIAAQNFEKIGSTQRAKEVTAVMASVTDNKIKKTASVKNNRNDFLEFLGIKVAGVNELGEEELGSPGEEQLLLEDPSYEKNLQPIELDETELKKYKPGTPKEIQDPNQVLQEIFESTPKKKQPQKRKKSKPESKQTPRSNIQDWAKTYSALRMILKNDNVVKKLQEGRHTKSISPQEYITKGKQRVNELMNSHGFVGPYEIDSETGKTWKEVIKESMPEINLGKTQ